MSKFKTAKEYVEILNKASEAYYNSDKTIMSDSEYDAIFDEFKKKFPKHPFFKTVGAKISSPSFKKTKHSIAMGSQSKVNTFSELQDWINKSLDKVKSLISKNNLTPSFLVSEKIDGFSLSLRYEKGELIEAITRGDGIEGEEVTANVKKMEAVPLTISLLEPLTVRGEAVLTKDKFKKFFSDKANPRNAAAGTVRRLDGERCEHLKFLAYDLISEKELPTEEYKLLLLEKLGFESPNYWVCLDVNKIHKIWQEYESDKRDSLPYEMDGLVVCINEKLLQNSLGIIDKRPRYSRAYKFSSQEGSTEIIDIAWYAGRTGRITPVAELNPLSLAGVTIKHATLHNLSELLKLKVTIGAKVQVKRAGDVIPKVERVLVEGNKKLSIPSSCPSCGENTSVEETFLMCHNSNCPAKHYENLLHWVKTLEIKGFGEELVNQLNEANLLSSPADFYTLTTEDIASLERRGEKSAEKVLKELKERTKISLPLFIKALGIINFSDKTAELVQPYFLTIDKLLLAQEEDLIKIHGVGEIVAKAIVNGLKERKSLIKKLLNYITILPYTTPPKNGKLSGKSFCFTGVRDKNLEKTIISLGGKIASGVSKELTYLVAKDPEENSSKLIKAKDLKVKILTLNEAQELVNS